MRCGTTRHDRIIGAKNCFGSVCHRGFFAIFAVNGRESPCPAWSIAGAGLPDRRGARGTATGHQTVIGSAIHLECIGR